MAFDIPEADPRFARFPRLICTDMRASDRSTPVLSSALVNEFKNLIASNITCQQRNFIHNKKDRDDDVLAQKTGHSTA